MEVDIIDRVRVDFAPADSDGAITLLNESGKFGERLVRCIVFASNGSLESLRQYIQMAELDPRDVIVAGEYGLGLQKRDLRVSFLIDSPEKFWIGEIASAISNRGYILRSLDSRPATIGPFEHTKDQGEGQAVFDGEPVEITVRKLDRKWTLHGDPDELELYDLDHPFEDEAAFRDAVSCFILAKQTAIS